jgi:hypothetical protein
VGFDKVKIKVKVNVKVSLKNHEGSDRGRNVRHSPLFNFILKFVTIVTAGLSAVRTCSSLPPGNSLGISSFR